MSWPNGYTFRATVTVDHTKCGSAGNLASFPVYFAGNLSLATVANGGYAQNANGYDIVFSSDAFGASPLNWELVNYNATTGVLEVWVNAGTGAAQVNSTTDALIYLFVGNSNISTFQGGATGTAWPSQYLLVSHLPNGSTLSAPDSTSNANNGALTNAPTAVAGKIDGGMGLNGTTQYAEKTVSVGLNITDKLVTVSGWAYWSASQPATIGTLFAKQRTTTYAYNLSIWAATNVAEWALYDGTNNPDARGATALAQSAWHYIVGTYDGSTMKVYADGVLDGSTPTSIDIASASAISRIGANAGSTPNFYFKGSLDEVRVVHAALSASWILAEYNNQNSPSTFYAVGSFLTSGDVSRGIRGLNRGLNRGLA